jgi:hypothetical protein
MIKMEWLSVLTVILFGLVAIYYMCILKDKILYRKILSFENAGIIKFHMGDKDIEFELKINDITPETFGTYCEINECVLYIDKNPVISVWRLKRFCKKYLLVENDDYNLTNLKKVLKAASKAYMKKLNTYFESHESSKKNII